METLEEAYRRCRPHVLAATARLTHDLDLAEECVQEACMRALTSWREQVPANPAAWLTTTARNLAIDRLRREATWRRKLPLLVVDTEPDDEPGLDLLRLMFVCCHPALAPPARLALTLRLLGGLSVEEIAAGLLVRPATVAARITRAKRKIAAAGLPFVVPSGPELTHRLDDVLAVIYLIHTAGHAPADGQTAVRGDLAAKARELARLLVGCLPESAEAVGLLALCLLDDARAPGRHHPEAGMVLLADQDRSGWDPALRLAGLATATRALRLGISAGQLGRYTLQAAISGVHAQAPNAAATNWDAILTLYDGLLRVWPNPVVALNRLAAASLAPGADLAAILAELDQLAASSALRDYRYLAATRADLLRRLGRRTEAASAYTQALSLTRNGAERGFLQRRLAEVTAPGSVSD
ncbi:RNA polymerase sigma factor [Buchananella hordeovulneris]|uniref:RNA polymerase subunit sigma-24 n=1 Tax=Buchananella hordeovulneris TaxID=52770 RepID=A0A1Q5PV12_9ACTO|nr:sigma-70 family RNA polymerase sigma factor [Buchananella hordeovulneris]OKL51260.1 RNA polymerase subunit sigma-24 [Buchananella hordeovulneris]